MQERLQNANNKKWIYLQVALAAFYLLTNMLVPTTMGFMKPLHFGMRKYLLIAMVLLYLYICRFEYSKELWIAGAYWAWLIVSRLLINGVGSLKADKGMMTEKVFYILLLGVGQIQNREERLRFMDIISTEIALFTTVCSVIGLWCCIIRKTLYTNSGKILCNLIEIKRIGIFGVNPNICGMWFLLGLILLMYLFFRYKKQRWLIVPAAVIHYFAVGLAYSRNVQLAFASCSAFLIVMGIRPIMSKLTVRVRACLLAAVFVASVPVAYKSFSLTQMVIGVVSETAYTISGGAVGYSDNAQMQETAVPKTDGSEKAQAISDDGETEKTDSTVYTADFSDHRGLRDSGRIEIWLTVIDTIKAEPMRLLRGCENDHVMDYSNPLLPRDYFHYHSSPIQIFMTSGIPGFLIAAALMLMICIKALKLFLSNKAEMSEKMLVMVVFSTVQYSLLEYMTDYFLATLTFFLVAGIVTQTWDDIRSEN